MKQLKHLTPNVYTSVVTDEVLKKIPDFTDLGAKKFKTDDNESVEEITTSSGKTDFLSFARNKKAAAVGDLYSKLVAPHLKVPMIVETWRRGAGGPLDSNCKDKLTVTNVKEMKINFANGKVKDSGVWPYIRDHSKWGMSADPKSPFVCIGDINRMESQKKRGGGTVCVKNPDLWKVFSEAVHDTEACKKQ